MHIENEGTVAKQKTAYFLDFDHTLFNTDVFFHIHVRTAFLQFGISRDLWEKSYEAVLLSGYTLEKHMAEMSQLAGERFPLVGMQRVLREQFSDLRRYLYPDVVPFLNRVRDHASLNLLSFGNPDWQAYKVRGCGLEPYFSEMFFTDKEQQKWEVTAAHAEKYKSLTVVDNNPSELDAIKDHTPQAWTFCINRVPENMEAAEEELARFAFLEARRYLAKPQRYQHFKIRSLEDMLP